MQIFQNTVLQNDIVLKQNCAKSHFLTDPCKNMGLAYGLLQDHIF